MLFINAKSTYVPNILGFDCSNTTMYANNSQYESNLNTLFNFLSTNATNPTGYHQAISGVDTNNTIYGHFLCRGDLNASSCQDCVTYATTISFPNVNCPNRKIATIWYDECLVRYSNKSFFGIMEILPGVIIWDLNNVTGNVSRFEEIVGNMFNSDIAVRAALGGSQKKFATNFANYTPSQTIYGLGQCTPDISPSDCNNCLLTGFGQLRISPSFKISQPSCVLRFEMYPFFNLSTLAPAPQPSQQLFPPLPLPQPPVGAPNQGEHITIFQSLQYDLITLQHATKNFSHENKLGEGGFGAVYKATLPNGSLLAVKKLSKNSSQGFEQFKNEALLVAKLQHRNLVQLLGFCLEDHEKLLVYEYVPNKSLDQLLFDSRNKHFLDWRTRYKIIRGIARGMSYLHHDSHCRIIHRDLKASNVLIDTDMNPKVADFGMSRMFGVDQSQGNTRRVVGTYGYMPPEYALHGKFSRKTDVYSYGVLVLEIISGKRNNMFYQSQDAEYLLSYAWKLWRNGMVLEFVDPTIRHLCSRNEVTRCMHLGLLCVQESVKDRPSMATIVLALDSYSVTLAVPRVPGFHVQSAQPYFSKEEMDLDKLPRNLTRFSINEASITEPQPR